MSASTGVHLCFFMARTRCPAGRVEGWDMGVERQGSGKGLEGWGVCTDTLQSLVIATHRKNAN